MKNLYQNFQELQDHETERILQSSEEQTCLLLFVAEWSGTAHILKHYLNGFSQEYQQDLAFFYTEESKAPQLAQHFQVEQIPTLIFLNDRQETKRIVGVPSKRRIAQLLQSASY